MSLFIVSTDFSISDIWEWRSSGGAKVPPSADGSVERKSEKLASFASGPKLERMLDQSWAEKLGDSVGGLCISVSFISWESGASPVKSNVDGDGVCDCVDGGRANEPGVSMVGSTVKASATAASVIKETYHHPW